jgi:cbb3-type cytochrome oxidase cytochrome c subunit
VCAALGAGIPVLVTESFWTDRDDFTGAMAVLPDLEGIGLARLKHWHAHIHLTKTEKPL